MITYEISQTGCIIKCFARDNGKKVGYCEISKVLETADIINVEVDSAYRRQGIGRELCKRLIAFAAEHGTEILTLEVRKSNAPAQSLYESLGFRKISERAGYYEDKEDAIVMRLEC